MLYLMLNTSTSASSPTSLFFLQINLCPQMTYRKVISLIVFVLFSVTYLIRFVNFTSHLQAKINGIQDLFGELVAP